MAISVQKELRYQGSASVVSLIVHMCNKVIGYPVVVRHGTAANIYAEYQFDGGLCTLFTRSTKDLYHITIHFKTSSDTDDAVLKKMTQINSTILNLVEVPDFLSVFFISPETVDEKPQLEDPRKLGNDAQPGNGTSQ